MNTEVGIAAQIDIMEVGIVDHEALMQEADGIEVEVLLVLEIWMTRPIYPYHVGILETFQKYR